MALDRNVLTKRSPCDRGATVREVSSRSIRAVACLTVFLMCSSRLVVAHSNIARSSASPDRKALHPISIAVFAPPDIKESLMMRVFDEACNETSFAATPLRRDISS